MGAFLDKPKTEKTNKSGAGNGLRYGLSSMQGWRVEMEDAHCAVVSLPNSLKDWSYFAVFDGHAGARVALLCAEKLLENILGSDDLQGSSIMDNITDCVSEKVKSGIRTGFLKLDSDMRKVPEIESGEDKSGSTAVVVLLSPQHIFFANCGDSRAILCRDGIVSYSTEDHKPVNPLEKERILNAGGSVMIQRVNGSLAVSRALGDFEYKNVKGKTPCEQLVSPEPEIKMERRLDGDEFIVLACDGIWDVMSNEEVCDFVRNRMQITESLEEICNQVVDTCLYRGSKDNMSIVIIALPGAPKISQDVIRREAELDKNLETKIEEIFNMYKDSDLNFSILLHELGRMNLKDLPPGGGLQSKHNTIEAIYNRLRPVGKEEADSTPVSMSWPYL